MDTLERTIAEVKRAVSIRESALPLNQLTKKVPGEEPDRDALAALRGGAGAVRVVAEIKKRDWHGRLVLDDSEVGVVADQYEAGGASLVGVQVDPILFGGCADDVTRARRAVNLPIMCSGFIVTPYQLHECRAYGADAVTLIAAALSEQALISLVERTKSLGMLPIVQAASRLEALQALESGADVISVNARNWDSLQVDRQVVNEILDMIPASKITLAEGGICSSLNVLEYALMGADAVIVGEALSLSPTKTRLVRDMVSAGQHPALAADRKKRAKEYFDTCLRSR